MATTAAGAAAGQAPPAEQPFVPAPSSVRFDWYQSEEYVMLSLYAKATSKAETEVNFSERKVHVKTTLKDGSAYDHTWHLTDAIDPEASSFVNTRMKIEFNNAMEGVSVILFT